MEEIGDNRAKKICHSESPVGPVYCCPFEGCDKVYRKPSKLREHTWAHTGERPFSCPFPGCDKSYRRSNHLTTHARTHDPETARPFVCSDASCGKAFATRQHLIRHEKIHKESLALKCTWPECTAAFSKRYQLRTHLCSHTGKRPFPCEEVGCERSFISANQLAKHKSSVHSDELRFVCGHPECSARFNKWTDLHQHVKSHPSVCGECGEAFARPRLLTKHIQRHHTPQTRFSCYWEGCTRTFATRRTLKTHILLKHERSTRFQCSHEGCDMTFPYESILKRHEAKHNRSSPRSRLCVKEPDRSVVEQLTGFNYASTGSKRKVACPFEDCSNAYLNEYGLKRHLASAAHRDDIDGLVTAAVAATTTSTIFTASTPSTESMSSTTPTTSSMPTASAMSIDVMIQNDTPVA